MVLRQGMGLEPAGVAVAVSAALGLARAMSSLLFGVQANDPLAFAGVSLVLLAFAFVAGYVPARRAVKVDPMVALRYE